MQQITMNFILFISLYFITYWFEFIFVFAEPENKINLTHNDLCF